MANTSQLITYNDSIYFQSKNVKVYPATFRGAYTIVGGDYNGQQYVFDPESRMPTEYSMLHAGSDISRNKSYIIDWKVTTAATSGNHATGTLKCVIGGYYFELYNVDLYDFVYTASGNHTPKYLCISTRQIELKNDTDSLTGAGDIDSKRVTYVLRSWESPDEVNLDLETENVGTWIFTGLRVNNSDTVGIAALKPVTVDKNGTPTINYAAFLPKIESGLGTDENATNTGIIPNSIQLGENSASYGRASIASGINTRAVGNFSSSTGSNTFAIGESSSAEGTGSVVQEYTTTAKHDNVITLNKVDGLIKGHILRYSNNYKDYYFKITNISGNDITVEGSDEGLADLPATDAPLAWVRDIAYGNSSHSEGYLTTASGANTHAEGNETLASGDESHSEGKYTVASGIRSHAEGEYTTASGDYSHSEGYGTASKQTVASGNYSHAEGYQTSATKTYAHSEGKLTIASGSASHAEGNQTTAKGNRAHAEGEQTNASGLYSHSEGQSTGAYGQSAHAEGVSTHAGRNEAGKKDADALAAHAEGYLTNATAKYTHAEGNNTLASGETSHAEGENTIARGDHSHAEGSTTEAIGVNSHAEGYNTQTSGAEAHAEGYYTQASGAGTHAEGDHTTASGNYSHAEGRDSIAEANFTHAEGEATHANGRSSHTEGGNTKTTSTATYAHAEGYGTEASKANAHAEGLGTSASGEDSHAEGYHTIASGKYSHAEGDYTKVTGLGAHAEGGGTEATKQWSHAEGGNTKASGDCAHAEGSNSIASGQYSHAEGDAVIASGWGAHAEGRGTKANGKWSHAEGGYTEARNDYSHTEGCGTIADNDYQHVFGKYNTIASGYVEIVGNGTGTNSEDRSNARTLDWDGNEWLAAGLSANKIDSRNSKATNTINGTLNVGKDINCSGKIGTNGTDIELRTSGSSSNDSGDIVWKYGNGNEKARLWTQDEYTAHAGLYYRTYNKDGTLLKSSRVAILDASTQTGALYATQFNATSDARLKENIIEFNSEKSILDLPVYKYDFINGAKGQIGCLAQDLQQICPEIVNENSEGYLTIQESKLVYLLLEEVKKLRKEIEELKK